MQMLAASVRATACASSTTASAVELVAKVTPRIIPGVVSIPQGAWYRPVMKDGRRVDVGGNINTLTSLRPSSLAKGNPQHTNLVEVVKA
ncbi:MAG: molybdopterin dinucleotide binding domain-containing protein [Sutterella wadsworthensis]